MIQVCKVYIYHHILYNILRWCQNYRTKLGVQKYGKIPYLRTPPDPDSARIRILFYNSFFCSIISGTLEVTVHIFASFYVSSGTPGEVIYWTYICIILCIFLGPRKRLFTVLVHIYLHHFMYLSGIPEKVTQKPEL